MGTRGAIGFRIGGVDKIAYNHFDSYPSGLGQEIVAYAKTIPDNYAVVRKLVEDWRAVGAGEVPSADIVAKATKLGIIDLSVSGQSDKDWYCVLRGAQGDLPKLLDVGVFEDSSSFLLDSLFCEYAYIINLDTNMFEFYVGFQKDWSAPGRYAGLAPKTETLNGKTCDVKYAGVKLVGEVPLGAIPDDWEERFYPTQSDDDDEG